MKTIQFGFEDLVVWDKAVDFAVKVIDVIDDIKTDRKHLRLMEQIEDAAASVPSNIAEGKGRFSKKEFTQYLYIARGSLYETVTRLEIFRRKKWVEEDQFLELANSAIEIGSMIKGLINSISPK